MILIFFSFSPIRFTEFKSILNGEGRGGGEG